MNLLKDDFISTNHGKVSLKTILTTDTDYQLQYYFDEIQLAMLQLLSSLATAVLQPTTVELRKYVADGVTAEQYDQKLSEMNSEWFEDDCFMRSEPEGEAKWFSAGIHKTVSGIESSKTKDASGLFSSLEQFSAICPDCMPACNYNYQMNVHAKAMGNGGATGIKGGGTLNVLLFSETLRETILLNCYCSDYFEKICPIDNAEERPMWVEPLKGRLSHDSKGKPVEIYESRSIGLLRGLFALAYHFQYDIHVGEVSCDICGCKTHRYITGFRHNKYKGKYGSTSIGRELGAGWWVSPYTPMKRLDDGIVGVRARDQNWQSWEDLCSIVIKHEIKEGDIPAPIVSQYSGEGISTKAVSCIVGGNILKPQLEATVVGRVYDLYPMPSSLNKKLSKVAQIIELGLEQKKRLSMALDLSKRFDKESVGYDPKFISAIRLSALNSFSTNAKQIIQNTLLDVDRREATELRKSAVKNLKQEAKRIYSGVQRKYQRDLPLFKALVKGEYLLSKSGGG